MKKLFPVLLGISLVCVIAYGLSRQFPEKFSRHRPEQIDPSKHRTRHAFHPSGEEDESSAKVPVVGEGPGEENGEKETKEVSSEPTNHDGGTFIVTDSGRFLEKGGIILRDHHALSPETLQGLRNGGIAHNDVEFLSALYIASQSLPTGTVNKPYHFAFEAVGGKLPYRWELITGKFDSSIRFDAKSGVIKGTSSKPLKIPFRIKVSDSDGNSDRADFELVIEEDNPLTLLTEELPDGFVGRPYEEKLEARGGDPPYSWNIVSGHLPDGLKLDKKTGLISGTPEKVELQLFDVAVTDKTQEYAFIKSLTINILDPSENFHIVTQTLDNAIISDSYEFTVTVEGGTPPYQNWKLIPTNTGGGSGGSSTATASASIPAFSRNPQKSSLAPQRTITAPAEPDPSPTISDTVPEWLEINAEGDPVSETKNWVGYAKLSGKVAPPAGIFRFSITVSDTSDPPETIKKAFELQVLDGGVTGFAATPGDGKIGLSWKNSSSEKYDHTEVIANIEDFPKDPTDGDLVYSGTGTHFLHMDLTNGQTYFYTTFAIKKDGTYFPAGNASQAQATPSNLSPGSVHAARVYGFHPLSSRGYGLLSSVLGPPQGNTAHTATAQTEVLSLHATAAPAPQTGRHGGNIVLEFDHLIFNGPGADFTVFENVFIVANQEHYKDFGIRFMEPAIVEVSMDAIHWFTMRYDYVPHPESDWGEIPDFGNPYAYRGFAGVNPTLNPPNPSQSGGDKFDLTDVDPRDPDLATLPGRKLRWARFIRITSTGDNWLKDAQGDLIRHAKHSGALSGRGSSGFDLDAVSAIHH